MASDEKRANAATGKQWRRIPNGIRVRHRMEGFDGTIDGLTEIVQGAGRNPDGKTQYRVDVGKGERRLAAEGDLLILAGQDGLVMMEKSTPEYRTHVTAQLHATFEGDRFVALP